MQGLYQVIAQLSLWWQVLEAGVLCLQDCTFHNLAGAENAVLQALASIDTASVVCAEQDQRVLYQQNPRAHFVVPLLI